MAEARYICRAIFALAVANGEVDDAEVELVGTEEEVEIAKGVEIAEEVAICGEADIVTTEHDLGAAEGILNGRLENPGE